METLKFRGDKRLRDRLMEPDSYQHPAKGHLLLWKAIIERYTQPGDTILDPLAGVGSSLLAALMGRNVICVELEDWMMPLLRANWERMRQHPMLGCELGQVTILQGDARALPLADGDAEAVISSPPYEESLSGENTDKARERKRQRYLAGEFETMRPDVLFSEKNIGARAMYGGGYTRPVDAVVSSPPYEQTLQGSGADAARKRIQEGRYHGKRPDVWLSPTNIAGSTFGNGYSHQSDNIGNMRGPAYWEAMTAVYRECWRVLRPGGVMVLVLKGFVRASVYQDLPQQTADLCESLGFRQFDAWRRELWSLSFWRILQATDKEETVVAHRPGMFDLDIQEVKAMKRVSNGKLDERLRFEEVRAFRKKRCG